MTSSRPSVLSCLIGADEARFRSVEWPKESSTFRTDPDWFRQIATMDVVRDPEVWLDCAPSLESFRTPGVLARSEARRRYVDGESIYILGLHRVVEPLREECGRLAADLGVPPSSVSVEAWGAGGPTKVGMHYDHDFNFNVQVVGGKQWWTAPNDSVVHPTASHHVGREQRVPGPKLPIAMPENARTWRVEPGDVVYLPQGVWHATETNEPTFALAFVIKPPTWAQQVGALLVERLHAQPRWRARVLGGRRVEHHAGLRAVAREALSAGAEVLGAMVPAELVHMSSWGGAPDLFERAPNVSGAHLEQHGDAGRLVWQMGGVTAHVAVPIWAFPAVEWTVTSVQPWSVAAIQQHVQEADAPFLGAVVLKMVEAGFIRRRGPLLGLDL